MTTGLINIVSQIDTAPKDGTEIMAWPRWTTEGNIWVKARWHKHPQVEGWICDEIDCGDYQFEPVIWKSLNVSETP